MNQTEADELTSMIESGLISRANLNEQTVCRLHLHLPAERKKRVTSISPSPTLLGSIEAKGEATRWILA